jgi:DNA recombination protein RmuC
VEIPALLLIALLILALGVLLLKVRQLVAESRLLSRECDQARFELERYTELKQENLQLKQTVEHVQKGFTDLSVEKVRLEERLAQENKAATEKLELLNNAREELSNQFKSLANNIFEEKTERFDKKSKVTLDGALNPIKEQLADFKKKVEDVYDKESKERVSLLHELGHLKTLNQQMSKDALNLTNALKGDNKAQGNWGEVILERVLEESGLHKGREYDTQVSLQSEQGRSQPDVVVHLPENKDLVIDSKVSLVDYERYCNHEDEATRKQALKDHVASVRNHIKGLSIKNYEGLEGIRTLDFVLIFIPIESAFMAAFEHDQAMFRDAYEKNIIVVGPTTLLATLRTIQSIWRYERQNKNAEEIARQAGAMHDKLVGFIHDMDKISIQLKRATEAHGDAMNKLSTGKGNLVTSTKRLEKLGAKVKKSMPGSVTEFKVDTGDDSPALEGAASNDDDGH